MLNVVSRALLALATLCSSLSRPALAADSVAVQYWLSPDGQQLYVKTAPKDRPAAVRLYYFNNEAGRLCYTFTVPGGWQLDEATGAMRSDDGKLSLGQSVQNARDLNAAKGANLVDAAVNAYQRQFSESLAALSGHGFKIARGPEFTTGPFETTGRKAVKWAASAVATKDGNDTLIKQNEVLVEVVTGWLFAIESSDDVARAALGSFATAPPPDCFWPFIREHFPQIKKP
jgi:hypothetical protein